MGRREIPQLPGGRDPKVQAAIDATILETLELLKIELKTKIDAGGLKGMDTAALLKELRGLYNAAKAPASTFMMQVAPRQLQAPVGRRDKILEADVLNDDVKNDLLRQQERLLDRMDHE